ncbi:hypothetical protein L7F22_033367 [Adiantum nelumboides]|nr:hypothetical protein [Adiantum nelumboides]
MRKQNDKEDPLEDAIQKCKEEMQETINKINPNLLSTIKTLEDRVTAQDEEIARLKQELEEVHSKNALEEGDRQPSVMEDHGVQALREDLRAEGQALREEVSTLKREFTELAEAKERGCLEDGEILPSMIDELNLIRAQRDKKGKRPMAGLVPDMVGDKPNSDASELCRAWGKVRDQTVLIFFDPGAKANSISPELASRLGIRSEEMGYTAEAGNLGCLQQEDYCTEQGKTLILDVKLKGESIPIVSASVISSVMKKHLSAYLVFAREVSDCDESNLSVLDKERYWTTASLQGSPYYGLTSNGSYPAQARPPIFSKLSLRQYRKLFSRVLLPWKLLPRHGTIAADTDFYPFGTHMFVPGYGWGEVEDRGSAIKGPKRIDLYHRSHNDALVWGRRKLTVLVVLPGQSTIDGLPIPGALKGFLKGLDWIRHLLF